MPTKRPRPYAYEGEPDGSLLAAYLNGRLEGVKPTTAELGEIGKLLNAFSAMRERKEHPLAHRVNGDHRLAYLAEVSGVLKEHRYELRPCLDERGCYRADRGPASFQGWALHVISELAERGLEGRLRICRYCGQWLYAHRDRQEFCHGGRCRKKYSKESSEYKEYQKGLMKVRYRVPVESKSRK
jgi:hypothetical protein